MFRFPECGVHVSRIKPFTFIWLSLFILGLGISACGGGGSAGGQPIQQPPTPTPTPSPTPNPNPNSAPTMTVEPAWVFTSGNAEDPGEIIQPKIAVDAEGHWVVTGSFKGSVKIGETTLISEGDEDVFVAKFAPDGTPEWSRSFGWIHPQHANALAIDGANQIWVVGQFFSALTFDFETLVSAGSYDIFIAKFDPNGQYLWGKAFGDALAQRATGIVIDAKENVWITGQASGELNFGSGLLLSPGGFDIFLAKFSTDGTSLFARRFGNGGVQLESFLAFDRSRYELFMAGVFNDSIDLSGSNLLVSAGEDLFFSKFNFDVQCQWSESFGDLYPQSIAKLALSPSGDLWAFGSYEGVLNFGNGDLVSQGLADLFLVQFDRTTGLSKFHQSFGNAQNQKAASMAVDADGDLLIAGTFKGSLDLGGQEPLMSDVLLAGDSLFIAKLDSTGNAVWSKNLSRSRSPDVVFSSAGDSVITFVDQSGHLSLLKLVEY